jgi:hypothetical protein
MFHVKHCGCGSSLDESQAGAVDSPSNLLHGFLTLPSFDVQMRSLRRDTETVGVRCAHHDEGVHRNLRISDVRQACVR